MTLPALSLVRLKNTCRLVPSRYPSVGILDTVAEPGDLEAIIELESWTNDRISTEIGVIHRIPEQEWVFGRPMSSVIMAAFCHPRAEGGRFNGSDRGAWYAGLSLETAHAETIFHRTAELAEVGVFESFVQVRTFFADFTAEFHDIRGNIDEYKRCYSPTSYVSSQRLAAELMSAGSNGILYQSVRHADGECIACFRPKLVKNVRQGPHFEYRWSGKAKPAIRQLK